MTGYLRFFQALLTKIAVLSVIFPLGPHSDAQGGEPAVPYISRAQLDQFGPNLRKHIEEYPIFIPQRSKTGGLIINVVDLKALFVDVDRMNEIEARTGEVWIQNVIPEFGIKECNTLFIDLIPEVSLDVSENGIYRRCMSLAIKSNNLESCFYQHRRGKGLVLTGPSSINYCYEEILKQRGRLEAILADQNCATVQKLTEKYGWATHHPQGNRDQKFSGSRYCQGDKRARRQMELSLENKGHENREDTFDTAEMIP
jgi:hypothetical protein